MRLEGKVALVTGAGRGMGLAYAKRFVAEGARVVLADIDQALVEGAVDALAAGGADVTANVVDVADPPSVRAMVDDAVAWGGRLDVLVNNAGIALARPMLDYTEEDFKRQMGVNLQGAFFALQSAVRVMLPARRGKIINVSSTSAFVSSTTPEVLYDVSKAGVRQLTVSAGAEFAPHGINVNGIAPGTILTDMSGGLLEAPERLARLEALIPMGRLGVPEELTGAAVFLASDESDYVCGHVIVVDGGRLLL